MVELQQKIKELLYITLSDVVDRKPSVILVVAENDHRQRAQRSTVRRADGDRRRTSPYWTSLVITNCLRATDACRSTAVAFCIHM